MGQDQATGVLNRRGWERALAAENDRCRRHDFDAAVAIGTVDTSRADGNRHALVRECAAAIQSSVRAHDAVACPQPGEFAILAVNVTAAAVPALELRLARVLADAAVPATVAVVRRVEVGALDTAWIAARQRVARRAADPLGRS